MPNRIGQRINIWDIPHQKEDAHSLNQFFANDAADFKPGRISSRVNDEQKRGLQVEENNQPNKQARDIDPANPRCFHGVNYTFSHGASGKEQQGSINLFLNG